MAADLEFVTNYLNDSIDTNKTNNELLEIKPILKQELKTIEDISALPDDVQAYVDGEQKQRKLLTNPLIRHVLGDNHPLAFSWHLIIEVVNFGSFYIDNSGQTSQLVRNQMEQERDLIQLPIGRILMMGEECFSSKYYPNTENFPVVGDYVHVVKYEGSSLKFGDVTCLIIKDIAIQTIANQADLQKYGCIQK